MNPPTQRTIELPSRGLAMHLRSWGEAGVPLVLVHGLGSTGRIWELVAPLMARRFRVLAPDQRGHGLTTKPETGYDWGDVSDDLIALLNALGLERVALVGHSWGADVALEFAVRHPQRLEVLGLVDGGIVDFQAHLGLLEAERLLEPQPVWGLRLEELKLAIAGWLASLPAPEQQAIILANYELKADGTVAPYLPFAPNMEIARALWAHRPPELYRELCVPTQVIQAIPAEPHDPETAMFHRWRSECAALARTTINEVEVLEMIDTVHDVPVQRPERLAQVWDAFYSRHVKP